jgi:putative thiamine transport system permease protein
MTRLLPALIIGLLGWPLLLGLPALAVGLWPGLMALLADPQCWPALRSALGSAVLGTAGALLLVLWLAAGRYPGRRFKRLQAWLAPLMAVPHAAWAVGLLFLLAPSGLLMRVPSLLLGWETPPQIITTQDPWGLSLSLALVFKEAAFMAWIMAAQLAAAPTERWMLICRSLGLSPSQGWWSVVVPWLLPRLRAPVLVAFAYALTPVDMALVLGPSSPPGLGVLALGWMNDPDVAVQAKGMAAAMLLLLPVLLLAVLWPSRTSILLHDRPRSAQPPEPLGSRVSSLVLGLMGLLLLGVVCALLLWSLAGSWFFPAPWPSQWTLQAWQAGSGALTNTALIAGLSVALALPLALLLLETWPARHDAWLWLPLLLPPLPLAWLMQAGFIRADLDGGLLALVWSHLPWVLPYVILVLLGPYRSVDRRWRLVGSSLGLPRWRLCLQVIWPMLMRPLALAAAVGVAVSCALYLPTALVGGGLWPTSATEAVLAAAGGNRRTAAVQSLLQTLLPLLVLLAAVALSTALARWRRGLA